MTDSPVILVAVVGLLAWGVFLCLMIPFANYRLGRHEVEILLFDRVVRRIPLFDIEDVRVGVRFPCEVWPARWGLRGRFLTIRRRHGLFRYLVICPRHPERLRTNIRFALGWKPDA